MYYSLPYKTKQFFWLLIKLAIVFGCGFFIYGKLVENNDLSFSRFWYILTKNNIFSLKNVTLLIIFTFVNHFIEIIKWKNLASFSNKINLKKATTQCLASLTASLITPNRIGEYGVKALYFDKPYRKQIVGLNLIGNFYQMFVTIIFGFFGFGVFVWQYNVNIDYHRIFKGLLLGFFIVSAFFFGAKNFNYKGYGVKNVKNFINKIPLKLNIKTAFYSFIRYAIFSHQFFFLFIIFKINISYLDAITAITTVYFIASIVPMLSLFDVVLKGTIAVWIFSFLGIEPIIILSITTLMWILNFVIPATIGSYFVLTFKTHTYK